MRLSLHFDLSEFLVSQTAARLGIDNTPPPAVVDQLRKTAELLEEVRAILGRPILISSGYRCPQLNAAIGGAQGSAHLWGGAADFTVPGFGAPLDVCREIAASAVRYDQLIHEFRAWCHIGRAIDDMGRRHVLTIDRAGTRWGLA